MSVLLELPEGVGLRGGSEVIHLSANHATRWTRCITREGEGGHDAKE